MKKEKSYGQDSVATSAQSAQSEFKIYFDCADNIYERGVVYDEMTPEKLSKWFKETKFKFPVQIMDDDDFRAHLTKDQDGVYILEVYRWNWVDDVVSDKWTLKTRKRLTAHNWFGITKFISDYISGDLQERNSWSENKTLWLA